MCFFYLSSSMKGRLLFGLLVIIHEGWFVFSRLAPSWKILSSKIKFMNENKWIHQIWRVCMELERKGEWGGFHSLQPCLTSPPMGNRLNSGRSTRTANIRAVAPFPCTCTTPCKRPFDLALSAAPSPTVQCQLCYRVHSEPTIINTKCFH